MTENQEIKALEYNDLTYEQKLTLFDLAAKALALNPRLTKDITDEAMLNTVLFNTAQSLHRIICIKR